MTKFYSNNKKSYIGGVGSANGCTQGELGWPKLHNKCEISPGKIKSSPPTSQGEISRFMHLVHGVISTSYFVNSPSTTKNRAFCGKLIYLTLGINFDTKKRACCWKKDV